MDDLYTYGVERIELRDVRPGDMVFISHAEVVRDQTLYQVHADRFTPIASVH